MAPPNQHARAAQARARCSGVQDKWTTATESGVFEEKVSSVLWRGQKGFRRASWLI
jgi:hypothetical protein